MIIKHSAAHREHRAKIAKEFLMSRLPTVAFLISLTACFYPAAAQAPAEAARPTPPTRDPNTPGYVMAKELPDGANAPKNADGNLILGPTHNPSLETTVPECRKEPSPTSP
jgi:enterochelin esterase family protein